MDAVLHERVVVLTLEATSLPYITPGRRIEIEELPIGFLRVTARHGFMEMPRISDVLRACRDRDIEIDPEQASFFLSREDAVPTPQIGMSKPRAWLFAVMARNARRPSEFLNLPHDRVIELGVEVEI